MWAGNFFDNWLVIDCEGAKVNITRESIMEVLQSTLNRMEAMLQQVEKLEKLLEEKQISKRAS